MPCAQAAASGSDWPTLCRYQADNDATPANPRAVMIGDSITDYWLGVSPGFFANGVIDRGISGQTSPQIALRFYQDVVRLHPRVVHILCGTNDLAGNTGPGSPTDYANMILTMVDLARANGIAVVLGSVLPAKAYFWAPAYQPAAQIVAVNQWLADLARTRELVYADYYSAMVGPDGGMKPGLSKDGVHPNATGYAVMEPIALAAINAAERQIRNR